MARYQAEEFVGNLNKAYAEGRKSCAYHRGYAEGRKSMEKDFRELLEITEELRESLWRVEGFGGSWPIITAFDIWRKERGIE
jgi:hypothetical protein